MYPRSEIPCLSCLQITVYLAPQSQCVSKDNKEVYTLAKFLSRVVIKHMLPYFNSLFKSAVFIEKIE